MLLMALGIQDRKGVHVLNQELLFSEHRFKELDPQTLIEAIRGHYRLERDDKSDKLIKPRRLVEEKWRWDCTVIDNPQDGEVNTLLLWNTITKKWELWLNNNGQWRILIDEKLRRWLKDVTR